MHGLLVALAWMMVSTGAALAKGRVETGLTMASPSLGHAMTYALYTPEQSAGATAPLPVLYLLHGRDDTEMAWLEHGAIAATMDRMIANGTVQPMAVVMPMAANSWYVDDVRPVGGPAKTHGPMATSFAEEFMPGIERRHNFASCRNGRAIGGLSMGGYGAVLYGLTRPSLFNAAISLSGSLFSNAQAEIEPRLPFYTRVFDGIYGTPFDVERFKTWTVFARLEAAPQPVDGLGIWLAAGDGDFAGILSGTVRLHQDLRRRKIESHLRIYDGDHSWALWSMAIEPALAWLSPRLSPCETPKP